MKHYKNPTTGEVFAYETEEERLQWGAEDLVAMTAAEVEAHLNPQPTSEQVQAQFTAAIQQRLDAFAQTRNYDGILSACTYATSTVPKFQAEGQACVNLRDATWSAAYNILAQVQAGTRPMPQSIVDIESDLPSLVWPGSTN